VSHAVALLAGPKPNWRTALRARWLTKDRTRERAARAIEGALDAAEKPPQSLTAAIPVARRAVLASRPQLVSLAEQLRAPAPVYAQGVALVLDLVTDAGSPLYQSGADLPDALSRIQLALDGHGE
jgi:hypothetical protein